MPTYSHGAHATPCAPSDTHPAAPAELSTAGIASLPGAEPAGQNAWHEGTPRHAFPAACTVRFQGHVGAYDVMCQIDLDLETR